uniref:Uncharacterized protein n=1 Tax=Arundo donax TaxID=35708 RepID=A0A0A9BG17_ARUDO
MTEWRRYI